MAPSTLAEPCETSRGSHVKDLVGRGLLRGGEGGIRTHGTVSRTPDFKSGSFDHSDTSPELYKYQFLNIQITNFGVALRI